jgi:hypothetical protein
VASSATGAKLLTGSNGSDGASAGVVVNEVATKRSVCPSGGLFATCSAPMLPVAPALFSVTTATFQRSPSFGPTRRARMSAPVPGV